jgi:alpha-tubulin suppressor-like RCC1 family protein
VQAWATGYNYYGQLGLGDTTDRSTPEQLLSPTNIVQVAAGSSHTVMLAHA